MSSKLRNFEPWTVQSDKFDRWKELNPGYESLRWLNIDQGQIHIGLQETVGAWYTDAGGLGSALDHQRVTFDSISGRDVFLIEPNVHGGGRSRSEAKARSRVAMEEVAAFSGLDIICLGTGFYSPFTLAFLIPIPSIEEMSRLYKLAKKRHDICNQAA